MNAYANNLRHMATLAQTRGDDAARIVLESAAGELDALRAERDRAQQACEQMGARIDALRGSLLRITSLIETQSDPDIDAMHDVAREALNV